MSHPSTPLGGPPTPLNHASGTSTPTSTASASGGGALDQVVAALNVLYHGTDNKAREQANEWLGQFQKSNDAWATAQVILFAPDAPAEPKLFAAQTFRQKITYDLSSLPEAQLVPLRDSLLSALTMFTSGPRVIRTQLCLALADLALQMTPQQWPDPIGFMVDLQGKDPNQAGSLLEFLQVVAEEYVHNMRIEVKNEFGAKQGNAAERGQQVIGLLSMYVQAPGITPALHNQCFECLAAWLRTGQAAASATAGTAVLASAFTALQDDELFDSAVDLLVDLIHETQELDENVAVIQEIVGRLLPLKSVVADAAIREDEDKMRGYCRVLVEAGEWYEQLIVQHQESFVPLVEAIASCATHENLEIVGITLGFWYRLSRGFYKARDSCRPIQAILGIFSDLVSTIIRHLHYPADDTPLIGQERDNFREFRHKIGDTLKDCCSVLGATTCLRKSLDIITNTLSSGANARWQDIEAPLFSMRTMGAEVDPSDNEVMPQIMELLPNLPSHPKIRYASTLVIGRYTQWIDYHPESIQYQLPYIIGGFDGDNEVSAAAAQAMKYLCKDCSRHLVGYLPQLHSFLQNVATRLPAEDLLELSEAVAHIVADVPMAERPQAIGMFVTPNIELVHAVTTGSTTPAASTMTTKQDLKAAMDALERIDMMLSILQEPIEQFPPECRQTCQQGWIVLDQFLVKFVEGASGVGEGEIAEKACVAIRRGIQFFEELAEPLAPSVLERMAACFEHSGASSYLWITAKTIERFAFKRDPALLTAAKSAVERQCAKVFAMLQTIAPAQMADVLDDFVNLVIAVIEYAPDVLFLSPSLPAAFQAALSTLTLLSPSILLSALDAVRATIGHESLQYDPNDPHLSPVYAPMYPQFANQIRSILASPPLLPLERFDPTASATASTITPAQQPSQSGLTTGSILVTLLLNLLVEGHEDLTSSVLTLFRLMSLQFADVLSSTLMTRSSAVAPVGSSALGPNGQGLNQGLESLSDRLVSDQDKLEFAQKYQAAVTSGNPNAVKDTFMWLMRTSRRQRERTRYGR
ncbi:Nuclear import receptor [Microbotryomycetes sp. JL201]|nr:Nuclear import receptor [Microbotryomycetes sp. JL201]